MNSLVKTVFFYVLILLLQAVLQGYIDIGPLFQFCLLPMVIVALPYGWRSIATMVAAFGIGLVADSISGGVPGINAASCVLVAATRDIVYRRFISTDNRSAASAPSIRTIGQIPYIKFISILSALYCLLFIFLDSFSFVPFGFNLLRFLVTFLVSTSLIILFSHFAPYE